jgi:drug/metabolite transporter (DMT)-like permease
VLFVTVTLLSWGSVLLFLKQLTGFIDAWTANGWRYGLSALFWLPLLLNHVVRGTLPHAIWRRAVVPSVFNVAGQVLYAFAPYYIGPGLAGFLVRVSLVSSTLGALAIFIDERALMKFRAFWIGMTLIVVGSVGTILLGAAPIRGATGVGVWCGISSGLCFGLYGVSVRYFMRGVPSMVAFSAISLYSAAGMIVLMIFFGKSHGLGVLELSGLNWFLLVSSAMIGIAIGHTCYYAAIARLGVAVSTAIVQIAPFIGGIASMLIFAEKLTSGQWISGFIMLGGAMMLLRAEQSRPRHVVKISTVPAFPVALEDVGDATALAAEK